MRKLVKSTPIKKSNASTVTSSDPLKAYLREVGRHPLIKHDATILLFEQMHASTDEAEKLKIKQTLIQSNLRLVVSVAKKYDGNGVNLLDLIQEGNIGLIRGIEGFDHTLGYRLGTYVTHWIKQSIRKYLTEAGRTVRLPAHIVDLAKRLRAVTTQFVQENNRQPTDRWLAKELSKAGCPISIDAIRSARDASGSVLSYSPTEVGGEGNTYAGWLEREIHDSSNWDIARPDDPEDVIFAGQLDGIVKEALLNLSPREEQVLRLRFGCLEDFNDQQTWPLTQEMADSIASRSDNNDDTFGGDK